MNWIDFVILAVIALSIGISLVRGFVREVMSIVVWIAAFWLSMRLSGPVAGLLEPYIETDVLRAGISFAIIFALTLLLGSIAAFLISRLMGNTALTRADRVLGAFFGAARGVLIVALAILLLGLTSVPREPFWRESLMITQLQPWVCKIGVREWLDDFRVYTPLARQRLLARGKRVSSYWDEFCD